MELYKLRRQTTSLQFNTSKSLWSSNIFQSWTPHPVPVITRIITCLVGNPYKPSLDTLPSHYFQVSSLRHPTSLEIWLSCFLARNAKTSSRRALVLVPNQAEHGETFWRLFVYLCILNLILFFQKELLFCVLTAYPVSFLVVLLQSHPLVKPLYPLQLSVSVKWSCM